LASHVLKNVSQVSGEQQSLLVVQLPSMGLQLPPVVAPADAPPPVEPALAEPPPLVLDPPPVAPELPVEPPVVPAPVLEPPAVAVPGPDVEPVSPDVPDPVVEVADPVESAEPVAPLVVELVPAVSVAVDPLPNPGVVLPLSTAQASPRMSMALAQEITVFVLTGISPRRNRWLFRIALG
jgi:hypothetical protein